MERTSGCRLRMLCPSCFDAEAEKAGVRYRFVDVDAMSWSDRPAPRSRGKRRRGRLFGGVFRVVLRLMEEGGASPRVLCSAAGR